MGSGSACIAQTSKTTKVDDKTNTKTSGGGGDGDGDGDTSLGPLPPAHVTDTGGGTRGGKNSGNSGNSGHSTGKKSVAKDDNGNDGSTSSGTGGGTAVLVVVLVLLVAAACVRYKYGVWCWHCRSSLRRKHGHGFQKVSEDERMEMQGLTTVDSENGGGAGGRGSLAEESLSSLEGEIDLSDLDSDGSL